jgi:hypothetical protein
MTQPNPRSVPLSPGLTAACANPACPEQGVEKDLSLMPAGYTEPVFCGECGEEIEVPRG